MFLELRNSEDEVLGSEAAVAAKERESGVMLLKENKLEREKHQIRVRQKKASEERRAKAAARHGSRGGPSMPNSLQTFLNSGPTTVDELDSYTRDGRDSSW